MQRDPMLVAVIDDDQATCLAVGRLLSVHQDHLVRTSTRRATTSTSRRSRAVVRARRHPMPDVDGLALVRAMREGGIEAPTVFMTASGHVPTAVEAMKEGAIDLLAKPFSAGELAAVMARAAESSERLPTSARVGDAVAAARPRHAA
jgi:FixJ family two-component response regulator